MLKKLIKTSLYVTNQQPVTTLPNCLHEEPRSDEAYLHDIEQKFGLTIDDDYGKVAMRRLRKAAPSLRKTTDKYGIIFYIINKKDIPAVVKRFSGAGLIEGDD